MVERNMCDARRAETKGNASQQNTRRTQSRESVSQALARIRQAFAVMTRGRSRMRENCTYGSARGARGNSRPYRDRRQFIRPDDSNRGRIVSLTLALKFFRFQ